MNKFLAILGLLLTSGAVHGQDLPVLPEVDITGVDMEEIYGLVGKEELTGLGDFFDMFHIDLTEAEIGTPKVSDFFNRDEKRIQYLKERTLGWLLHFVLSGRLTKYMEQAQGIYILVAGEEKVLHEDFFHGLLTVHPAIAGSQEGLAFRNSLRTSLEKIRRLKAMLDEHRALLGNGEYDYFLSALNQLLTIKQDFLRDFKHITTGHVLQATDGQRIKVMERLRQATHQADRGLYALSMTLTQLLLHRSHEETTLASLQAWFGVTTEVR